MTTLVKIAAGSNTSSVAGAIAGIIRQGGEPELRVMGAAAVNQAIKAVAVARDYLRSEGIDLAVMPSFLEITINGDIRTAICLFVRKV